MNKNKCKNFKLIAPTKITYRRQRKSRLYKCFSAPPIFCILLLRLIITKLAKYILQVQVMFVWKRNKLYYIYINTICKWKAISKVFFNYPQSISPLHGLLVSFIWQQIFIKIDKVENKMVPLSNRFSLFLCHLLQSGTFNLMVLFNASSSCLFNSQ